MSQEKIDGLVDLEAILGRFRHAHSFAMDKDVASALHLSPQDFHHRKKRGSLLPLMISYSIATNVNLHWLLTGQGEPDPFRAGQEPTISPEQCLSPDDFVILPLLESQVRAGPEGEILYEEIRDYYPFKRWWIEK